MMKKTFTILCTLLLAFLLSTVFVTAANAETVLFKDIREEAKKVVPNSPEDFALGRKLMVEIRKLAAEKQLVDGQVHFYTEPVMFRAGKLFYTYKKWFDHNLFVSRDMWDGSKYEFQPLSLRKSNELCRLAGFDGFSPILSTKRMTLVDVVKSAVADERFPVKSRTVPVFWFKPQGLSMPQMKQLKFCADNPTWRFKGKPVAFSYNSDKFSPKKVAAELKKVKDSVGVDLAYVHGVGSLWGTGGDPYHNYINHGETSAVMILKCFDKLTEYLEIGEGIQFRNRLPDRNSDLFVPFYDNVLLPLYAAACAQKKFEGKKILGLSVQAAYAYYWGSQTLDRRGTRTLRTYLELCRKHKIDFVHGIEWDETNEDTSLDPSVCKPMGCARVTRYYSNLMKGLPPVAFPGDDLSLPNLIISQKRQYILGEKFDVEVLNVPDTRENIPYTVKVQLFDHNGKAFYTSGELKFNASELSDHIITIPLEQLAKVRAVYPKLTVNYKGKVRVIDSGLPASIIRATASRDYSWYITPLRNLMFPAREKVKFVNAGFYDKGMVRKVTAEVELDFPGRKLNMVEAVQNSMDIYAYDPENEFLQNDPDRKLFRISSLYMNKTAFSGIAAELTISLANAPGACYFKPVMGKRNRYIEDASKKYQQIAWDKDIVYKKAAIRRHQLVTLFSVPVKSLETAVLTISGTRISGPDKGKKLYWQLPLKELGGYGVKMKTFEDGFHTVVETFFKAELLPMPINKSGVSFKAAIANDLPEAVLMFRAVSKDGRVWWSKPFVPTPDSGKKCKVSVYEITRKAVDLEVDAVRVPHIVYKFDPAYGLDALTTDAGREFYGGLGSFGTLPSGFEGASHSQNAVSFAAQLAQDLQQQPARPRPDWVKCADGRWALSFAPGKGQFVVFPPTTVPQRAGVTINIEINPDSLADQVIFGQCGPKYLAGFQLRLNNGKLVIDYKNRRPHDLKSSYSPLDTHRSSLTLVPGKWNKVTLSYNGRGFTLAVNGRSEFFAQNGHSLWLSVFTLGGTNPNNRKKLESFAGKIRSLEILHKPLK